MKSNILELDNTYRGLFQACKRKYYLTRILGLAPERGSNALRYGSTWHGFKEGYYSYIKEHGWKEDGGAIQRASEYGKAVWDHETFVNGQTFDESDYRTLAAAGESFLECCTEFAYDKGSLEVVETEQIFDHIMELSDEERFLLLGLADKEIHFTGRLDVQVNLSGLPWLIEEKSTGQPAQTQLNRLNRSPQILGYSYAGKHTLDFEVQGCLVSIHQLSCRRKQNGEWGKLTKAFVRVPQIFTDEDLEAWRYSFLATCNDLVYYQESNMWPMQFDSCYQFGRCQFCNLCERNIPLEEIAGIAESEGVAPEGYIILHKDVKDFSTQKILKESVV